MRTRLRYVSGAGQSNDTAGWGINRADADDISVSKTAMLKI